MRFPRHFPRGTRPSRDVPDVCERNGCDTKASYVVFHYGQRRETYACAWHAVWWTMGEDGARIGTSSLLDAG